MHLFAGSDASFWLDSSLADAGRARFSYMGDARGPRAKLVTYRSRSREVEIRQGTVAESRTQSIFDFLQEQIPLHPPAGPSLPFDFIGGYVGYFGYELKGELDGDAGDEATTPDSMWIMADRFIAFDHLERQTWVVCLDEGPLSEDNGKWVSATCKTLSDVLPPPPSVQKAGAASLTAMTWRIDLSDYRQLVVRSQAEILQGETYEVCLTNQLVGEGRIDGLDVYRTLRTHNPAPYAAYLKAPAVAVLCASPELFLHIAPDRTVDSKPIKGTARRGTTTIEDDEIAIQLVEDEKTRAENLMIVDLLRNDLNRVCEVGSVHVPRLFELESYATVHQLVSTIRGRLRDDLTAMDCVRATFPGGSMTGAPKIRTMKILDGFEQAPRGIYSGSIGFISLNGSAKLNIVIRTIVCADERVTIGSGGAIVSMSDPDEEVEEIVLKVRAQLDALRRCGAPLAT
jgi:para-aminobenzoate synthetase